MYAPAKTRDVRAGPGETRDEPARDGIHFDDHHDRNCFGCVPRGESCLGTSRQDYIDLASDKLGRQVREQFAIPGGGPVLDADIATFVISDLAETLQESLPFSRWFLGQGWQQ